MSDCPACLNGCGGVRSDCPLRDWSEPSPRRGRPSTYRREVADRICAELAAGRSLRSICEAEGMPPRSTVEGWVISDCDGFGGRYARARDLGLEQMADETIAIADDGRNDTSTDEDGRTLTNYDVIQRSKLRVDTRKWILSKRLPKTYGDKLDLTHSGEVAVRDLTDDQLLAQLASAQRLLRDLGIHLGGSGDEAPEGEAQALDLLSGQRPPEA
ncbi:hypothetical protein M0638_27425 [Roseomonas sp. NAR14]|uniref:Terminase small subunit n=1 Tax=Roseomonas acroporae TaxID=2937791 RepID=A0A9X1YE18_9PROT|nr:hypothetical protein [Roseomonas acroporae]MCK8788092.1 hypothetical protein [Roseomonas acroporae]